LRGYVCVCVCVLVRVCRLWGVDTLYAPNPTPNPNGPPCRELFAALDRCEGILARQRYIAGDALTEADVRLFMWAGARQRAGLGFGVDGL
jgi:glutathione S-transferase